MYQEANYLASQGRNGDTMLVHMSPQEVGGLQALARKGGTSLTINPQTGMPEAFNLRKLLPLAIGLGAGALGAGPLLAGSAVGGLEAMRTGSLKEGLMAGLGAASGANLAGAISSFGAPATGTPSALAAATEPARGGIALTGATTAPAVPNLLDPYQPIAPTTGPVGVPVSGAPLTMQDFANQALASSTRNLSQFGQGFQNVMANPMEFASANKMALGSAALSALPGLMPGTPEMETGEPGMIRPYGLEIDNVSGTPADPFGRERERVRYRFTPQPIYYAAQGGIVPMAEGGIANADPSSIETSSPNVISPETAKVYQSIARIQSMSGLPQLDISAFRTAEPSPMAGIGATPPVERAPTYQQPSMNSSEVDYGVRMPTPAAPSAPSAVMQQVEYGLGGTPVYRNTPGQRAGYDIGLRRYAQGGLTNVPRFLSGGGDGMSDSIPATINNKQPARLADGEFVIPADVVSHLGNGSSKAGAKQLYAMMDRVRQSRTGKRRQAPAINPKKTMPA